MTTGQKEGEGIEPLPKELIAPLPTCVARGKLSFGGM